MRKRLRFTLRSMLVLFAVLALAMAYVGNQARRERVALQRISASGGRVFYRCEDLDESTIAGAETETYTSTPPGSAWLQKLLGTSFCCSGTQIYLTGKQDRETLEAACQMPKLRRLDIANAMVERALIDELQTKYPSVEIVGK